MELNKNDQSKAVALDLPYNNTAPRAYNKKELCRLYNVSIKTFRQWLLPFAEEIGIVRGKYYTILQVQTIFARLGVPVIVAFFLLRSVIAGFYKQSLQ